MVVAKARPFLAALGSNLGFRPKATFSLSALNGRKAEFCARLPPAEGVPGEGGVSQSRLAAILVADVVGYISLAEAEEELPLARLRALRSDPRFDAAIEEYRKAIDVGLRRSYLSAPVGRLRASGQDGRDKGGARRAPSPHSRNRDQMDEEHLPNLQAVFDGLGKAGLAEE